VSGPSGRARRESFAERQARLGAIDEPEVVLAAAFRYLEARARSVAETRRRLTEAGYRRELVEGAIERLLTIGLLDDEVFARNWVESRDRASPRGETALRRELRLRGVEGAIVDATLQARRSGEAEIRLGSRRPDAADEDAGTEGADPEEAAARRLLDRRRRDLDRVVDPRKRRARAYALMARNGFAPEIAGRLAAELVAEVDAES
jgi:regulatory protein